MSSLARSSSVQRESEGGVGRTVVAPSAADGHASRALLGRERPGRSSGAGQDEVGGGAASEGRGGGHRRAAGRAGRGAEGEGGRAGGEHGGLGVRVGWVCWVEVMVGVGVRLQGRPADRARGRHPPAERPDVMTRAAWRNSDPPSLASTTHGCRLHSGLQSGMAWHGRLGQEGVCAVGRTGMATWRAVVSIYSGVRLARRGYKRGEGSAALRPKALRREESRCWEVGGKRRGEKSGRRAGRGDA